MCIPTLASCSPEQLQGVRYSSSADLYSLAFIALELFVPFTTAHERALAFAELRATDKSSNNSSINSSSSRNSSAPRAPAELHTRAPELALLVQQLAASDPAQRPTALQLLHNPALQRYSDSDTADATAETAALAAAQQELLAKDTRLREQEAVIVDLRKRLSELELAASGRSNEVSLAASLAASPAVRPSDAPHISSLQEQGLLLSHTTATKSN
jgi:serine/threonine protein kinase